MQNKISPNSTLHDASSNQTLSKKMGSRIQYIIIQKPASSRGTRMPFIINGIGTWYYGKRHIHTYDGTCQFCGQVGPLASYDTTLFFVVVFLPVIPLGRKRI